MQTSFGEQSGDAQGISTHGGRVSGHTTSSSASSPTLQIISSPKERRDPPPLIRYESDSESSEPGRPSLVEGEFKHGQWQTDPSSTSRGSHRIGCFQHGMGSMLQECEDKRSVVQGGFITSHQLQRDVGSISSTAVICEEYAGCSYQTQSR